jgi:hypothetical protein
MADASTLLGGDGLAQEGALDFSIQLGHPLFDAICAAWVLVPADQAEGGGGVAQFPGDGGLALVFDLGFEEFTPGHR